MEYSEAKTLNDMRSAMAEKGVKWVNLSAEDKSIFKKLKDLRVATPEEKVEASTKVEEAPVEEAILDVKSSEEAKKIAAEVKKEEVKDYNDLKNGIMDVLFKKNLDGMFRGNVRRMVKTSISSKIELISMLHELIDVADSGADKGVIRQFIKKVNA